jgi:hypothetical protein
MKRTRILAAAFVLGVVGYLLAQTFSAPAFMLGPSVATSLAQCSTPAAHQAALCPVENPAGTVGWYQWNGTAYVPLVPPPSQLQFGTANCPAWSNGAGAIKLGPGCTETTP